MTQRQDVVSSETESFTYDYLDRLTGVSGPYTETYSFDMTGNILSKNGAMYAYGDQPHAVTSYNGTSYAYDNNGNMVTRGSQTSTPCRKKVTGQALGRGEPSRHGDRWGHLRI
jgi:hypothetical protein